MSHYISQKSRLCRLSLIAPLIVLSCLNTAAHSATITETTLVEQKDIPNVRKIDFMAFDANKDGILMMQEVGDVLFSTFDLDKNGAIDNIEYDKRPVMTVIPMEATTLKFYDFASDGTVEHVELSKEDFLKQSNLMAFDKDMDGLSARDFMGSEVKAMDTNHNNLIEKDEWQQGYVDKVKPKAVFQERYNH